MINEKYSFKDFSGRDLSEVDPLELNNTTIKGSCFYQENNPDSVIFPVGMIGVIFERCNLDNVSVPAGNIIRADCINRRIKVQIDKEDWIIGPDLKPIEPVEKERFISEGKSIDPIDIKDPDKE